MTKIIGWTWVPSAKDQIANVVSTKLQQKHGIKFLIVDKAQQQPLACESAVGALYH